MTEATYTHHLCLALRGVVAPGAPDGVMDLGALSASVSAQIVASDDASLAPLIRKGALGLMLGTGGVVEGDATFARRLSAASASVRESFVKEARGRALLHIMKKGTITSFEPKIVVESPSFSTCLDDIDPAEDPRQSQHEVSSVVGALSMSHSRLAGVKKVAGALIVDRADGHPIYWCQITMGTASAYISSPFADADIPLLRTRYSALYANTSLERVTRLIRSSLENDGDRLRAFLAGWNALEILLGKVFNTYEAVLRTQVAKDTAAGTDTELRSLLKDKYAVADRFAVIAAILSPATAADDFKLFRSMKGTRDKLSHGQDVREESLATDEIRDLARRYLALHVGRPYPTS